MKLETIGIEAPKDFPSDTYNEIHKFVLSCGYNESHFDLWREWASAWNGLVYRYGSSSIRNILSHRSTPPRNFNLGGERDKQTDWGEITLDENTTSDRLKWLSQTLHLLLEDLNYFIKKHLPKQPIQ